MRTGLGFAVLLVAVAACDSSSRTALPGAPNRGSDATTGGDTGLTGSTDGAPAGDAAPISDARAGADAQSIDVGSQPDVGAGVDVGHPASLDATTALDAGPVAADATLGNRDSGGGAGDAGPLDQTCDPDLTASAVGGNPVGMWTYRTACVASSALAAVQMACPTAVLSNQVQASSGLLELTSVGTFSRNVIDTASADVQVPSFCAGIAGGCSGVESTIRSVVPGATSRCMDDGAGGCNCNMSVVITINDAGTYAINGNTITASPTGGGTALQYHYSASGNVLKYQGYSSNTYDNRTSYVLTP